MILDEIVRDKKIRLVEHKKKIDENTMKELAENNTRKSISFYNALAKEGLSIIGEFKKASPSLGVIQNKMLLTDRIDQYNKAVEAISCLTEEDHFHGSAEYLQEIRNISPLPILRKDFIIDPYQVYEAKIIGADAILLIAAILEQKEMEELYQLAYSLGLDVLVEVHDEEELRRALKMKAKIIGVNNRNLKDFTIDLNTTKVLAELTQKEADYQPLFISESGVTEDKHIKFLKECKIDALLIGRAFMETENPQQLAVSWKKI